MQALILGMLHRDNFNKYGKVAKRLLSNDEEMLEILQLIEKSYEVSNSNSITLLDLEVAAGKNLTEKKIKNITPVLKSLAMAEYDDDLLFDYLQDAEIRNWAYNVAITGIEVAEGSKKVNVLLQELENVPTLEIKEEAVFTTDDLGELKTSQYNGKRFKWRMSVLNSLLGSLPLGKFGFIFARPETGKTTFLCSEMVYMAAQCEENRPLLWINNEGDSDDIKLRCYQSMFSKTMFELFDNAERYREEYNLKVGKKLLMTANLDSNSKRAIEDLCKKHSPSILLIDQLDNVSGFPTNEKEEVYQGKIYRWARELAAKWDCVVIGVSQASVSAEGKKYLQQSDIEKAKTEKSKHADFILGIGMSYDPVESELRFLHTCKDKLSGCTLKDENLRHGYATVRIKGDVARYYDV